MFDVTKGKSHYGSGGGYNHFAGRFVLVLITYVESSLMFFYLLVLISLHVSRSETLPVHLFLATLQVRIVCCIQKTFRIIVLRVFASFGTYGN